MTTLRTAGWVPCTGAEGPHLRFALWVQGCPLACPGCCNPELWPADGGREVAVATLVAEVLAAHAAYGVEGITIVREGVRDESVVGGIVGGGEEGSVQEDLAGLVVDLVFVPRSPRDLHDHHQAVFHPRDATEKV